MKKVLLALITCLCSIAFCTAAPVAHWSFDKLEGDTIKDQAGNNNGILVGKKIDGCIQPGLFGNAFFFDSGKHQICIKHSPDISLENNFTVEFLMMPHHVIGFHTLFWKGDRSVKPQEINYFFDTRDAKLELKTKDAFGKWIVFSTKPLLKLNKWYHVIVTYKDGKCEFFVNGKKQEIGCYEGGKRKNNLVTNKSDAFIGDGANAVSRAYPFCGLIDDIKIYRGRVIKTIPTSKWNALLNKYEKRMRHLNVLRTKQALTLKNESTEKYKRLFSANSLRKDVPFTTTVMPVTTRLVKEPYFINKVGELKRKAVISAAQNEYESFQIITLGSPIRNTRNISIEASDLINTNGKGRIPAENVTLGYVKCVKTEKPDIAVDFVGYIPDVVLNGQTKFNVGKQDFGIVLAKVFSGNAAPGKYKGAATVSCGDYSEKVEIELTVYNFALSERASLKMAFSFFESFYSKWYDLKKIPDERKMQIYNFLLSYRISPNNIYHGSSAYPQIRFLEKLRSRINFFTFSGGGPGKPVTSEKLSKIVARKGVTYKKLKAAGLLEDAYFYSYDELGCNEKRIPAARQLLPAMKKAFPDLKMMQTSFPEPEIINLFNTWVPIFSYFSSKKKLDILNRLKQRGDEIWWYAADQPCHPYPNFFLDYPVFDCRIISTLSYMYKVEGVLYWCINREWRNNVSIRKQWPDAEWKPYIFHISNGSRKAKNGMGNLVYPGKNGNLLPSLRLENLRDGLEDYEYLICLKNAVSKLEKSNVSDKKVLLEKARKMLQIPKNVAVAVNKWSSNPENLIKYRNELGLIISRINSKLKQ